MNVSFSSSLLANYRHHRVINFVLVFVSLTSFNRSPPKNRQIYICRSSLSLPPPLPSLRARVVFPFPLLVVDGCCCCVVVLVHIKVSLLVFCLLFCTRFLHMPPPRAAGDDAICFVCCWLICTRFVGFAR